jgi:hypothetical protein
VKLFEDGKATDKDFVYRKREQDRYEKVDDKVTEYVHGVMEAKFKMQI